MIQHIFPGLHIIEAGLQTTFYSFLMKFIDSNEDFIHDLTPNIWSLI